MTVFVFRASTFVTYLYVERKIPGAVQGVLGALGVHGPELIREAEVDIVPESGFVCPVVPQRVKRRHDVLLASLTVLRGSRQRRQVHQQVLGPVLQVLRGCRRATMLANPLADVIGKPLEEFLEVFRDDKPVASHVAAIPDCESVAPVALLFHRRAGEINNPVSGFDGIALHGELSFERNVDNMRASLRGRDELTVEVQRALSLPTKKEAAHVMDVVIASLEATLLNNLGTDGFTLKLNGFGKFYVHYRPGTRRKVGFTGQTIHTKMRRKVKFISLGMLRRCERVD